jgi:predicted negative regulator of RcsB-dependent stress response
MPKRKIKEELKKTDFLLATFEKWKAWARENTRTCIIGGAVIVLVCLSGWAFLAYRSNKNQQAQYLLSVGIASFQEYSLANKADALPKAEADFRKVARESSDGLRDAAELYLAQIAAIKGKKDEARTLYNRIVRNASNSVTKQLAERGLQNLEKTAKQ